MSATRDFWVLGQSPDGALTADFDYAYDTKEDAEEADRQLQLHGFRPMTAFHVRLTVIDEAAPDPMVELRRHVEECPIDVDNGRFVTHAFSLVQVKDWITELRRLTGVKL